MEEKIEICLFHYKHCKSNCLAKKVQVDENLIEINYNDCKINLNTSSNSLHTNHEFIYQTPPRVSSLNKKELNNWIQSIINSCSCKLNNPTFFILFWKGENFCILCYKQRIYK